MTRYALAALLTIVAAPGCQQKAKGPSVDPAPFRAALEAHMTRQKWDVKVDSFESLEVQDTRATAVVRVAHAESTGLKPEWKVSFLKKDGNWIVDTVER